MFLLWKSILWIPIAFLIDIGTPFKWNNDGSSLRNISEKSIRDDYNNKRFEHYLSKIFMSAVFIIGCLLLIFLTVVSNGKVLWLFPLITIIILLIDGFMMFARFIYFREEEKKAEQRQELVVIDCWKDTSLTGLLAERKLARAKFAEEFETRTGRKPSDYDY